MKKTIFTLLMFMGVSMMIQAQVEIKPSFGVNSTHLTTEHVDWKTQGRLGYQFGAGILIGEKFYFEPGIYWATVSQNLTDASDPSTEPDEFKNTINSIRVPVFLGYHILGNEESFADLRLFAGPGASFVTGVKSEHDDLSKDDFKSMMFDVDVGAGVDVWFFFLEWHYVFGLTPVYKEGSDAKFQSFYGNLGIRIRL